MKLFDYFDEKIKKLNSWDITVLKWLAFLIGVVAGAFYSAFVLSNITYFSAAILILIVLWLKAFFGK